MAFRFEMDDRAYNNMLEAIHVLEATDAAGKSADISFINDDFWLQDTAVIENIEYRNGEWNIYLVFAHYQLPLKFLKRKIVKFSCKRKASIVAHYMRRQAAKDQRGTLTVNKDLINISFN